MPINAISGGNAIGGFPVESGPPENTEGVFFNSTTGKWEFAVPAGAGDMIAATYDPTAVGGDAFDMANMAEAADAKILTGAERTRLTNLGSARSYQLAFENVGVTTSGTITPPAGSTIVIDRFPDGADGLACLAGTDARPNWEASYTAGGSLITATLAANGNWTLSDTPVADTCICYVISVAPESSAVGAAIIPGVSFSEDHALTHVNGVDTIDGDKLDITFVPTNYVRDASPSEADDVTDLSAHLKGIDYLLRNVVREEAGRAGYATTAQVISGAIDSTILDEGAYQMFLRIYSEDGVTDDLDTVTIGGEIPLARDVIYLSALSSVYTITIKHGTGNILCRDETDIVLRYGGAVYMIFDGSNWLATDGLVSHAASHVTGQADAIQSATNAQDGLMTAAYATAVESSTAAQHTQGTDQGLDTGGANAVTAAQAKAGYTHSGVTTGNPHSVTAAEAGADPAGTGASEVASHLSAFAHDDIATNTAKVTNATHSGDVTGDSVTTIANDVVTNAKAANMATQTLKGRATAGTGDPEDLTATQARAILNVADGAAADVWTAFSDDDIDIADSPATLATIAFVAGESTTWHIKGLMKKAGNLQPFDAFLAVNAVDDGYGGYNYTVCLHMVRVAEIGDCSDVTFYDGSDDPLSTVSGTDVLFKATVASDDWGISGRYMEVASL